MTQPVQTWRVELQGDKFDLEDFPLWLSGCDVAVIQSGDAYSLSIPVELLGGSAPELVRPFALLLVERFNAIGHLLNPSYRPITLSDKTFGFNADGVLVSTSIQVAGAEMRIKAGHLQMLINGAPQADPREGLAKPILRAAVHSTRVQDALAVLSRPNLTWSELYLLFELVEGDVGAEMYELGWIARSQATLFSRTANSYALLRSAARHGKENQVPPENPMSHSSAVGLIRALVLAWLRTSASKCDSAG